MSDQTAQDIMDEFFAGGQIGMIGEQDAKAAVHYLRNGPAYMMSEPAQRYAALVGLMLEQLGGR